MPNNPLLARVHGPWVPLLTLVLVVGVLWAAKAVLLPLALGIVLAFTLSPLTRVFDRLHLPRVAGVILTMLLALGVVGGIGYIVFEQLADLSAQSTQYTSSMRRKVAQLRPADDAALRQLSRTVERVTEQLDDNAAELRRAQPVRVVPRRLTPLERLREMAGSIFEPLASAVIVLVLVAFMLGQREDLRDRFIRLSGADNVTLTTRLLNEAAQRVSQFLVWQTLINLIFGALVAAGLYWIGVPYAALWGGLTAVLRFVPYVGAVLSALIPAALAFAIFPGWAETLTTLAFVLLLDMSTAYFVEPLVFGYRTGVSSFALLVSALFWIWVWGPVGLLLSTPLTVCIAVLGRHVRSLRFLAVIFADEPALTPHVRFYQRLLARDDDEASALAQRKWSELGSTGIIDAMLVPTLALAARHRSQNEITGEDLKFVVDIVAEIMEQMAPDSALPHQGAPLVLGIAVRSQPDQMVLALLGTALGANGIAMEAAPAEADSEAALARIIERRPALVCIVAASPARGTEVRSYCRRLRTQLPEARLLVLRPQLDEADDSPSVARMREAGAHCVAHTVKEALEGCAELLGLQRPAAAASAGHAIANSTLAPLKKRIAVGG